MGATLRYDHYKVLGVARDASPRDLKRAYRERAKTYHPDVNPSDTAARAFHAVHEAYSVLSDPEKRALYDARLAFHRPAGQVPPQDPSNKVRQHTRYTRYGTQDPKPATRLQRLAFLGLHLTGLLFGIATVGTVLVGITFNDWPTYMILFSLPGALAIPESMDGLRG